MKAMVLDVVSWPARMMALAQSQPSAEAVKHVALLT